MVVAAPALPAPKIELEVRVIARYTHHSGDRGGSQGRAPQVGVQDHTGGVDHPAERASFFLGQGRFHLARVPSGIRKRVLVPVLRGAVPRVGDRLAQSLDRARATEAGLERTNGLSSEEPLERGDVAARVGHRGTPGGPTWVVSGWEPRESGGGDRSTAASPLPNGMRLMFATPVTTSW